MKTFASTALDFMCRHINKIMLGNLLLSCTLVACGVTPEKIRHAVNPGIAVEYQESNKPFSGMFFTSDSVMEEYEYDDAYCLLYDDADANMFNVEICVDLETYQRVIDAHKTGRNLVGKLVLNEDDSTDDLQVFTYMPDPEFEMAEASAEQCED